MNRRTAQRPKRCEYEFPVAAGRNATKTQKTSTQEAFLMHFKARCVFRETVLTHKLGDPPKIHIHQNSPQKDPHWETTYSKRLFFGRNHLILRHRDMRDEIQRNKWKQYDEMKLIGMMRRWWNEESAADDDVGDDDDDDDDDDNGKCWRLVRTLFSF